jgi:hypothetical protein
VTIKVSLAETIMRLTVPVLASIIGLLLAVPPALSDVPPPPPEKKGPQCFFVRSFENWKAPDNKTIYIRVDLHRYFRLDLAGTCGSLRSPGAYLVTKFRGSDVVCSALDWNISVVDGPHGIPQACIVKTMTELTPAEAAAIPKGSRP